MPWLESTDDLRVLEMPDPLDTYIRPNDAPSGVLTYDALETIGVSSTDGIDLATRIRQIAAQRGVDTVVVAEPNRRTFPGRNGPQYAIFDRKPFSWIWPYRTVDQTYCYVAFITETAKVG